MNSKAVPWAWFQEGYDHEPTDPNGKTTHDSYIGHHNGPQYFGYVSENAKETKHLFGLNDFFQLIGHGNLPSDGVVYLRGGYENIDGLKPVDPDPNVQANFTGDDHHPGYSDAGISDALIAREVNAIAKSRYWSQSAIIITYDESEGDYDHVAPQVLEDGPTGLPLVRGPRIPLTIVSPYANAHMISHESGDHNSIIRFIDQLFGLPYLADLPDEAKARIKGKAMFGQSNLGPDDDQVSSIHDLLSGFDFARLAGKVAPLPASYALLPDKFASQTRPLGNHACASLGIIPEDIARGINNPIPSDFNPRPGTDPSMNAYSAPTNPGH
jgi:phospholipase C